MFKKLMISLLLITAIFVARAQVISKSVFTLAQNQKTIQSIFLRLDRTSFIIENNALVIPDKVGGRVIYYDRFDSVNRVGKIKSITGNSKTLIVIESKRGL